MSASKRASVPERTLHEYASSAKSETKKIESDECSPKSEHTELTKSHELAVEEANFMSSAKTDERHSKHLKLLTDGCEFIKHGRRGSPHLRFVWLDVRVPESSSAIRWCEVHAAEREKKTQVRGSGKRTIFLRDITAIALGRVTEVFKRSKSRMVDDETEDFCFSIIAKSRTIDLAAKSIALRNSWVDALRNLSGVS